MPLSSPERKRVVKRVLAASVVAWILLLAWPGHSELLAHCGALDSGWMPPGVFFRMILAMNSPGSLAIGWFLMLSAMMVPSLAAPVLHVYAQSFSRRRVRSLAEFAIGYTTVWVPVAVVFLGIALALRILISQVYLQATAFAAVALVWQASPIKQHCLNRCRSHSPLRVFGIAADCDAFLFGLIHGFWCAGSCWAWMLLPMMLSPGWHLAAMGATTILIFCERLDPPAAPAWRWRGLKTAGRVLVAQTRIAFHWRLRPGTITHQH